MWPQHALYISLDILHFWCLPVSFGTTCSKRCTHTCDTRGTCDTHVHHHMWFLLYCLLRWWAVAETWFTLQSWTSSGFVLVNKAAYSLMDTWNEAAHTWLCNEPIKKGNSCFSVTRSIQNRSPEVVAARVWRCAPLGEYILRKCISRELASVS